MSVAARAGRSRLPVYLLCWICLIADGYDLMSYGATLPALIGGEPFHLTVARAGHIGSLALAGMLAGSLTAGTLTDRVGRRRIFIASVTVFSVGMLLTALAPTVEMFVAFRVLTCFGVGGLLPTAVALASEFASPETRSRTLGFVLTGPPLGMVAAAFLASRVVEEHGFRPVYAAAGVILLVVPLLVRYLPESPSFLAARGDAASATLVRTTYGLPVPAQPAVAATGPASTVGSPVAALLRGRLLVPTLLIWGTTFFSLLTVFGITTWLPQVMAKSGYGLGSSITFLLVYCLGAVIGTLIAASLADRFGPKPLVIVGYVCAAVALLAVATEPATGALVVLVLLAGFGGFGTQNILNDFIARFYPASMRASGLGWALGVGRLGAIVGPTFGAWVVSGKDPLAATATAFAVTAVLGAVVMALVPRAARADAYTPSTTNEVAEEVAR
ncbi:MFS transporter [Mumia sp. Pv 4-285]|uniref:MFS transporter n=1 Tax=Mumia qirimensis TaxID=3234852 RepID=UPI00351D30FF